MGLASNVAEVLIQFRKRRDSEDLEDEEIHELWMDSKGQIQELFLNEDWELSDRTIAREVHESLNVMSRPNEDNEMEPYYQDVIDDLRTQKTYTAYLYFPELVEIPVGKKIGELEIVEEPTAKEHLMERINKAFEGSEYHTKLYKGRAWGRFEFSSYK